MQKSSHRIQAQSLLNYYPVVLLLKETHILGELSPDMDKPTREAIKDLMKESVMKYGALQISYYAGQGATSSAGSTKAYFNNTQGNRTNHAVLVVG